MEHRENMGEMANNENKVIAGTGRVLEALNTVEDITIEEASNILTLSLVSVLRSVGVLEEENSAIKICIKDGDIHIVTLDSAGQEIIPETEENKAQNKSTIE